MYTPHPSATLQSLFRSRPFQGADPREAAFLFVGLDANYAPDIESSGAFPSILRYHEDGVGFWQKHGVHHPFLLPGYSGDGKRYHKNFAQIGFSAAHAANVSFIELLDVPTSGRSKLVADDLGERHLGVLRDLILNGPARHVFLSAGVSRLMRETSVFAWLPRNPTGQRDGLDVLWERQQKTVYSHLHFSNYGKFEARRKLEAMAIRRLAD